MTTPPTLPTSPWYPAVSTMWSRVARTCSPERFLRSVCGADRREAAAARGLAILMDPRVPVFLDEAAHFLVRMRPATTLELQETRGVLTGAVQWSQTIALWSHGVGKGERFICGAPQRSYDSVENRLVLDVLQRLANAARAVDSRSQLVLDDAEVARTIDVARATRALCRHPRLAAVRPDQLAPRDVSRLATMLRRQGDPCCRLALELRRRVAQPVPPGIIGRCGSGDVNNQLGVLLTAADAMAAHGLDREAPVVTDHGVAIGPLEFRRDGIDAGLWFGPHPVTFSHEPAGFDGSGWVVNDAASARAVLAAVADDLRACRPAERVA